MKIDKIFFSHMHKPFKKTHQNIRKDEDDVQSSTPEERKRGWGGVGTFILKRLEEEVEMQHNNIMSPFLFFSLLTLHLTPHLVDKQQNTNVHL